MGPSEREVLRSGPTRAPLREWITPTWRRRGVVGMALVLGVMCGAGAAWWLNGRSADDGGAPNTPAAPSADVRLVLSGVVAPTQPNGRHGPAEHGPLWIDAVLLHGRGPGIATVTSIHRSGGSLSIRVPALPVELSANHSYERIRLEITARDCGLAAEWTPSAQPFTLTWQDGRGDTHEDTAGDHDATVELDVIRYFDMVCGDQPPR